MLQIKGSNGGVTFGRFFYRSITSLKPIDGFRSNLAKHKEATEEKRNLILSILKSTSGKREARDYLQKYSLLKDIDDIQSRRIDYKDINNFQLSIKEQQEYIKTKYDKIIDQLIGGGEPGQLDLSTTVGQNRPPAELAVTDILRVALIKIRDFENISQDILTGIGHTIYRMVRLGVSPIIVFDNDHELMVPQAPSYSQSISKIVEQSNRLIEAINLATLNKNHRLESRSVRGTFEIDSDGKLQMTLPETLLIPLSQGILPIVYPIAYNNQTSGQEILSSKKVLDCIVTELAEFGEEYSNDPLLSIEKIIFLDPEGGIPSIERFKSSHVLINLIQEFEDIQSELHIGFLKPSKRDIHLHNLDAMKELLDKLPNSTTGLITTPEIATIQDQKKETNAIIYNVLTDRPVISSSLPVNLAKTPLLNTTIIRKGIPVHILESSDINGTFSLANHPEIDLDKLTELINDSFKRKLDLKEYLKRIDNRVLCVIISGDYQGAAIVTKEAGGAPYLDKFAVSSKSQGSAGVADIVFKSLLKQFPERLIWRSRKNNPVNKWYFERSKLNLATNKNSNWKLFYHGSQPVTEEELKTYTEVCETIKPTWLDQGM